MSEASSFLQGLLFGMVLQLSVGPVCLAVFRRSLDGRIGSALWMVVGVAAADALYIVLAVLGVSSLLQVESLRVTVGLAGALVLLVFGVGYFRANSSSARVEKGSPSGVASLRHGFLLTLTNPLTIVFWGGVLAGFAASARLEGATALYSFAVGCVSATLLFLSAVTGLGDVLRPLLGRPRALLWLNRVVGLVLVGFAVKLVVDVLAR